MVDFPSRPARRPTFPPPRPPELDERVARLERFEEEQIAKNGDVVDELRGVRADVGQIKESLVLLVAQRDEAVKSRDRWLKAGTGIATALAISLIGWLAHIAMVVQSAKVAP